MLQIGHIKSGFQHIHVVEGLNAIVRSLRGYEESLMTERGTYSSLNPDLFLPNRKLFLDGVIQSSTLGDEAYHEALVHPAMFAHRYGPKRVAVIGGGEGATLREVLKHKSVEVCTMVEIDPGIVKAAREWLPSMNDCSDFGNGNCFDEDRTDLICEDAFEWFLSRFSNSENQQDFRTDQFDVIIMDALDPEDTIEFAVKLYRDEQFWATLKNALTQDGILVMQLGQSPDHRHPSEQFGRFHNRASLFQTVEKIGFRATFVYYETHCDFEFPWSYLVACISEECVHEWHQNEAELNLRIHERILPSMSGLPTLKYFDGATMQAYRIPRKEWEIVYCRRDPRPEECDLLLNVKEAASWFEAFGIVSLLEKRFVAKKDMKKGSAISWADTSFVDKSSEENAFASANLARAAESIKEALKACNLTSSVTRNNLSSKISPFWDRHAYIKHVEFLTRGISRGEQLACL
jgi:spermidine synthase